MPIDFSILTGEEFELLCRDLLDSLGIQIIEGPARGSDRKKDMIIQYTVKDKIGRLQKYKLLVQCKNKAKSKKSIYEKDLGDIRSACQIHNTNGYFLITSTIPSVSVQDILIAINEEGKYITHYWDKYILETYISKCKNGLDILERFGLLKTEYQLYQYMGLVLEEFELIQEITQKLGFELSVYQEMDEQISDPNSCYIAYGNVRSLHLDDRPIGRLVDNLDIFQELNHLELNNIELHCIPKSIFRMLHLEKLYLPINNINIIPSEITMLKNLKEFDISNNPVEQLEIGGEFIKKLERFWIDKSQIPLFREIFEDLKNKNILLNSKNIEIEGLSQDEVDSFFRNL